MPVSVTCHESTSAAVKAYKGAIQTWLNTPGNNKHNGEEFDQALIIGTSHYSTSVWDPHQSNHISIQLSNAAYRLRGEYCVLHWREGNGPKVWAPGRTTEAEQEQRRAVRRAKKAKSRKNTQNTAQPKQAGSSTTATATASSSRTTQTPAAPKPATAFVPRQVQQKKPAPGQAQPKKPVPNNPAPPKK